MKKKKLLNSIPVETKESNKGLIIKIILIVILLVANGYLVFYILNRPELKDNTKKIDVVNEKPTPKEIIGNTWVDGNKKITFSEKEFTYYDNITDYYGGTYTLKKGDQALEEMGYTEEDLNREFGEGINKENVLSILMKPQKRMINNVDKSKVIKNNTEWWFLLIVKDDDTALGYNKTLDERYELKKVVQ